MLVGCRDATSKPQKPNRLIPIAVVASVALVALIRGLNRDQISQLKQIQIQTKPDVANMYINSGPTIPRVSSPPVQGKYITSIKLTGGTTWTTSIEGWFGNSNPATTDPTFTLGTPSNQNSVTYQCASPKFINKLSLWMAEQPLCPSSNKYCGNQLARMEVFCNDGKPAKVVTSKGLDQFGVRLGSLRTPYTVQLNKPLSGISVVTGSVIGYSALFRVQFFEQECPPEKPVVGEFFIPMASDNNVPYTQVKSLIEANPGRGCPAIVCTLFNQVEAVLRVTSCPVEATGIPFTWYYMHSFISETKTMKNGKYIGFLMRTHLEKCKPVLAPSGPKMVRDIAAADRQTGATLKNFFENLLYTEKIYPQIMLTDGTNEYIFSLPRRIGSGMYIVNGETSKPNVMLRVEMKISDGSLFFAKDTYDINTKKETPIAICHGFVFKELTFEANRESELDMFKTSQLKIDWDKNVKLIY